jgi:hypothetical protein
MNITAIKSIPNAFLLAILVGRAVFKGYDKTYSGRSKPPRLNLEVVRHSIWASPILVRALDLTENEFEQSVAAQFGPEPERRVIGMDLTGSASLNA